MADTTHDTADHLVGQWRLEELRRERQAQNDSFISRACKAGYGFACNDLESAAINLRAFTRGMIHVDGLPLYIKQAREALDMIERAVAAAKS